MLCALTTTHDYRKKKVNMSGCTVFREAFAEHFIIIMFQVSPYQRFKPIKLVYLIALCVCGCLCGCWVVFFLSFRCPTHPFHIIHFRLYLAFHCNFVHCSSFARLSSPFASPSSSPLSLSFSVYLAVFFLTLSFPPQFQLNLKCAHFQYSIFNHMAQL